jgi:hypothetical protein
MAWYSDTELYAVDNQRNLKSYASSSDGWTMTERGTVSSGIDQHMFFNPEKTRLAVIENPSTNITNPSKVDIFHSASGTWSLITLDNTDIVAKPRGITWPTENEIIIGMPGYNVPSNGTGRVRHFRYDGSSDWDLVQSVSGFSSNTSLTKNLGTFVYYNRGSEELLVGAVANDPLAVMNIIKSSSAGYFPTSNLHLNTAVRSVIDHDDFGIASDEYQSAPNIGIRSFAGENLHVDPNDNDRFAIVTQGPTTGIRDGVNYVFIESGSSGYKFSTIEDNAINTTGNGYMGGMSYTGGFFVGHGTGSTSFQGFTVYENILSGTPAGLTINPTSLTLSEGQDGEITVVLDAQPSSDVVVSASLHTDFDGRATLTNHLLTFTNANWNAAQTLQITASQDSIANGTAGPDPITFSVVDGSSDDVYDGISGTATLTVNDNETAGFTISPTSLSLAEGQDGEVSVVLDVQPAGNVVVTASLHNTDFNGRASLTNHILTFTDGNWNTPQILQVTASQDSLINGQEGPNNITFSIVDASSDDNYDPVGDQTVALTVTDNDTAGFTLGKASLTLTEGQDDTVSVVLNAQPDSNVVITSSLHSNFDGRATLTNHLVTFTNGNWNVPQLLQVTASQDSLINGNVGPNNITFSIVDASSDDNFDSLSDQNVALTVQDNDAAGFTVGTGSLTLTEGQDDTISVVLNAQPNSNVVITASLHSNFDGRATLTNHLLTFTNGNWNVTQLLQVSASQDLIANKNLGPNNITFSVVDASSDNNFDALSDQNVALTVLNNDVIVLGEPRLGGLITSANVITSETGGEDEMSVRLFVQPTHNVTVSISGVDSTEFTVSHTSLVFTSDNWNEDQILRFKGLPDGSVDGDITTTITLTAASSDSAYNGISITKNVTNLDTTPSGGFSDPCTLLSEDYTINYYTCALGQYSYHKNLPFRLGSAKNISNIREQTSAGSHKTFLGEPKT